MLGAQTRVGARPVAYITEKYQRIIMLPYQQVLYGCWSCWMSAPSKVRHCCGASGDGPHSTYTNGGRPGYDDVRLI